MVMKREFKQLANQGPSCQDDRQLKRRCPQHVLSEIPKYSVSQLGHIEPVSFVKSCLKAHCVNADINDTAYFLEPTNEHLAAYEPDVIEAIRSNDIEYLRSVKAEGRSLQGCNRFGESLIHLACRRSSMDIVAFLVADGYVCLRVKDDVGRTPLHDACWKKEPNFALVDLILDAEPELLLVADKRGHTPLEYVRREHWGQWIQYLAVRMKKDINRLSITK